MTPAEYDAFMRTPVNGHHQHQSVCVEGNYYCGSIYPAPDWFQSLNWEPKVVNRHWTTSLRFIRTSTCK
jgi:hypothetical protein